MEHQVFHLQFMRIILFAEKWLTIAFLLFAIVVEKRKEIFAAIAAILFLSFQKISADYKALEECFGVPQGRQLTLL